MADCRCTSASKLSRAESAHGLGGALLRGCIFIHREEALMWMTFTKALTSAMQPPVWERAYAVTETKRCVEGAAGTRGADEIITEGLFVILPITHEKRRRFSSSPSLVMQLRGLEPLPKYMDMNLNHARMPIPPQLHMQFPFPNS